MLQHTRKTAQKYMYHHAAPKKIERDPVQLWLSDLRYNADMECMCVLQGKSLLQQLDKYSLNATAVKNGIDTIRSESHLISSEFSKLFDFLESEKWQKVRPYTLQITCHIRTLIHECNQIIPNSPSYMLEQQEVVMGECAKLAQHVESVLADNQTPLKIPVVNQLTFLGQSFSRLVDLALGFLVQKVITALDNADNPISLSTSIGTVVSLGLEGEHMCYIIAREGGVRALLDICKMSGLGYAHAQALRALATICCVAESIFEIEKEGGVDCLTDILCDVKCKENVKGEVAGVIAQVTSPCLENLQQLSGLVDNMEDILRALLGLCNSTRSHEIFLLAAAAIANITFMDSLACDILLQYDAPRILIQSCGTQIADSLFVKDQVATILANMVAVDSCRVGVIENNGIEACLGLLEEHPANYKKPTELAACERIQQKAAIALTRICRDVETAQTITEFQGIPRLVWLCKNTKERNKSDAVLVACLAALRKIISLYRPDDITDMDYQQLIQPKLMDSFLICTNTDENFV